MLFGGRSWNMTSVFTNKILIRIYPCWFCQMGDQWFRYTWSCLKRTKYVKETVCSNRTFNNAAYHFDAKKSAHCSLVLVRDYIFQFDTAIRNNVWSVHTKRLRFHAASRMGMEPFSSFAIDADVMCGRTFSAIEFFTNTPKSRCWLGACANFFKLLKIELIFNT